ncbi:hypothetical protein CKO11_12280 [Rhodobacter sp. TJ_12]|uniref:DUF2065 domain-containing protein n=1 Tax=Rhodobacter sp. TJ_12 TaxID=2029399 RepID=UPI001CBF0B37|nr:DUF2065 domain-containing protein [Rhodobacter sp. TJ_12]MBZ4023235.1 hypothetical protein [Rhodobacter sp. TJ_12]
MAAFFTALGLVLVIEGLALALAPSRMEELVAFLASLRPETRRRIGLGAVAAGVGIVALVRAFS